MGILSGNPFPDATPEFFAHMQSAFRAAVGGNVEVIRPFAMMSKVDVLRRGRDLPLELTFSCLRPIHERPCGCCNKCAERRRAFVEARVPDRTVYATEDACTK
jgi:7-cyano-7-deazaguanine synthase